jgi:hypothetical protein
VNAEFQWWLLILGIVIGGALVYLVLADVQGDRDADEQAADELSLDELDEDLDDDAPWAVPAASPPGTTRSSSAPVPADPDAADPDAADHDSAPERGPTSAWHDARVQRDGAQGETTVADVP